MSKNYRPLPPRLELCKWFRYDGETGVLYRIAEINRRTLRPQLVCPERKAGSPNKAGYLFCRVPGLGSTHAVARIAWMLQSGEDPGEKEVDHINLDKQDNRWRNLRLAEKKQNCRNRRKPVAMNGSTPFSRYKGVSVVREKRGKGKSYIVAQICTNGKSMRLGIFPTEEAAHAAYCEAAKKYHGEFARFE